MKTTQTKAMKTTRLTGTVLRILVILSLLGQAAPITAREPAAAHGR